MSNEQICWKVVKTKKGYAIIPKREFRCPFCGRKLILHHFTVSQDAIKRFYHADVHLKCPEDGFFTTFGIAISKEDYEKLRSSPLHGKTLTDELLEIEEIELSEEDEEIIRKRLKQLGYWGG